MSAVIQNHNFDQVDAILGPFIHAHAETAGVLLADKNIPVISPLSKDTGKGVKNVYYGMPFEKNSELKLLNYIVEQNGVLVSIHSSSKNNLYSTINEQYSTIKQFTFNEKGLFDFTLFKTHLQKNKKNYILLDSDKLIQVISVINQLKILKKEFDIQLVVTEISDALEFDEIKSKDLAALNLLYVSGYNDIDTIEFEKFATNFRKDNKNNPNHYAVRGFDTTFDLILRLLQPEGFEKSLEYETEYIKSKFNYTNNINEGVYILQYQSDYSIKKIL